MSIRSLGHTNEPITEYLDTLREYARRVVLLGEELSEGEQAHKEDTFRRFAEMGGSCRMSEREMVALMLRGVLNDIPPCWCTMCRESYLDTQSE